MGDRKSARSERRLLKKMSCALGYCTDADMALCRTRSPQVSLRRQHSVESMRRALNNEPEPEPGWYFHSMGHQHGPISLEVLRERHANGLLAPDLRSLTEFWREGD